MNSDNRSSAEIERDIEREREELRDTLHEIRDRYSVEAIARQVGRQVQDHGGDIARSVLESVKRNPIPLALTGIGLAWLMSGRSGRLPAGRRYRVHDYDRGYYYDSDHDDDHGLREFGYPEGAQASEGDSGDWPAGYRADRAPSTGESASQRWDRLREGAADRWDSARDDASGRWDHARASASDRLRSGRSSVASGWSSVKSSILGGLGSARHYARGTRASAAELRDRLYEGTSGMSEEARKRVVAAREAAWNAQSRLEEALKRRGDDAAEMFESQPLVVGAIAVAAGAALGSLLPRTDMEDAAVGEESDRLFDEANRIYHEESAKLSKVAQAAGEAAADKVREKRAELDEATGGRGPAKAAADELREAADDVAEKARAEARRQGLGQSGAGSTSTGGAGNGRQ